MIKTLAAAAALAVPKPQAPAPAIDLAAPASQLEAQLPLIMEAQTPQAGVHASGQALEDALTGAASVQAPEAPLAAPAAMAAFTPVPLAGGQGFSLKTLRVSVNRQPAPPKERAQSGHMARARKRYNAPPQPVDGLPVYGMHGQAPVVMALASQADRAVWTDGQAVWITAPGRGELIDTMSPIDARRVGISADGRTSIVGVVRPAGNAKHAVHLVEDSAPMKIVAFESPVAGLALSGTGERAAVVLESGELYVWDHKKGEARRYALKMRLGSEPSLALSVDGSRLVVGGASGVLVLDLADDVWQRRYLPFREYRAQATAAAVSDDGSRVAAIDDEGAVYFWDFKNGDEAVMPGPYGRGALALSMRGSRGLLWVSADGAYTRTWLASDGGTLLERRETGRDVSTAALRPDLALEGWHRPNSQVRIVELATPAAPAPVQPASAAAPKPVPAAVLAPADSHELRALRRDIMDRYGILKADRLVPTLTLWLGDHLEIFRIAGLKNLERLALRGDREAQLVLAARAK